MDEANDHVWHDRNDFGDFDRPFTRRRWPLKPVSGEAGRYRGADLELVAYPIREFVGAHRTKTRGRIPAAR